jgi:ketosteroid isomerase-like protein
LPNEFSIDVAVLGASVVRSDVVYAQDSAEKDVRKAMDDNFAAIMHKDAAALGRQYTDDYYRISESGKVSGKAETIANFTNPDFVVTKLQPSDVQIRVHGNVAIVTELVTSVGGPTGKATTEHTSRQTVVWVKQHDMWQKHVLQMTSTTPIPESAYSH